MTDDTELPLLQKPVLTVEEASRISTFGQTTVYRAIKLGELTARKMGSRTVVLRSDLDAWIASFSRTNTAAPGPSAEAAEALRKEGVPTK